MTTPINIKNILYHSVNSKVLSINVYVVVEPDTTDVEGIFPSSIVSVVRELNAIIDPASIRRKYGLSFGKKLITAIARDNPINGKNISIGISNLTTHKRTNALVGE